MSIGYQKAATILNAMKAKKDLEKALATSSSVTWTEFPAGPPMLEAMSAGSLTDEVIAGQQQVADAFHKIKLLPKQVFVKEIVWQNS